MLPATQKIYKVVVLEMNFKVDSLQEKCRFTLPIRKTQVLEIIFLLYLEDKPGSKNDCFTWTKMFLIKKKKNFIGGLKKLLEYQYLIFRLLQYSLWQLQWFVNYVLYFNIYIYLLILVNSLFKK